jgi:hypothetical protein
MDCRGKVEEAWVWGGKDGGKENVQIKAQQSIIMIKTNKLHHFGNNLVTT